MARVVALGSIGERQPLVVRAGHTLPPILVAVSLSGGAPLDPEGSTLVLRLYKEEGGVELPDAFDPPTYVGLTSDGRPRFLVSQSRERLAAALALAGAPPRKPPVWHLWWTCSFLDAGGQMFPLYFGTFDVYLGAAGA